MTISSKLQELEQRQRRKQKFHKAYMEIAHVIAELSYCEKKQVGALIVNDRNIISYGFNGSVSGQSNCCEDENGKTLPGVIHAEINALLKAGTEAKGADMYITLYPCLECTKLAAQAGIKRIYYAEDHKNDGRIEQYNMQAIKL